MGRTSPLNPPTTAHGSWTPRTKTRPVDWFSRSALVAGFPACGFAEGLARYGLLLGRYDVAVIGGFMYHQLVPFGAGGTATPEQMQARVATSARVFTERFWAGGPRPLGTRWSSPAPSPPTAPCRPSTRPALSDDELAEHVGRCRDHLEAMHRAAPSLQRALPEWRPATSWPARMEWTGATAGELMGLLRGTSAISTGFATTELDALADAVAASDSARTALASSGDAEAVLSALTVDPDAGPAARAYLDAVRFRSLGYDVGDLTASEMPDVLLSAVRTMVSGWPTPAVPGDDTDTALIESGNRCRTSTSSTSMSDSTEARRVNRLRDERGAYTDSVARLGWHGVRLLECGRRLLSTDKVLDPEHAVELEVTEARSPTSGIHPGPTAEELAARYRWRTATPVEPPRHSWGCRVGTTPPTRRFSRLPLPARTHRALGVILEHMLKPHIPNAGLRYVPNGEVVVCGLSVNTGMYEGIPRGSFTTRQGWPACSRETSW